MFIVRTLKAAVSSLPHTLKIAWRNLWRNWKRSAITLAAVTINMAILLFTLSLMEGFMEQTLGYISNLSTGEVQVANPEYSEERSFYESVKDPDAVLAFADEHGLPASARSYGYSLASLGNKSAGARLTGIDPARDKQVFDLYKHIARGEYLDDKAELGVVIGSKLAEIIEAKPGDEIVVLAQAADGSLANELFTVKGILKSVGGEIDRTGAYIHKDDFETLFVSGGRVHEIAVNTRGKFPPEEVKEMIAGKFTEDKVSTWHELLPELSTIIQMFDQVTFLMCSVFCLAAAVGVTNTLLMAAYERMREFGVMKALGATPMKIVGEVASEAFVLSFLASVLGLLIGLPICWYIQVYGIDTSSLAGNVSMSGVAFDPIWKGSLKLDHITLSMGVVWLFSVIASLYPAIIAGRLNPVDAMRRH